MGKIEDLKNQRKDLSQDFLAREIIESVKSDEKFFLEFMNFLERSFERRKIILCVLRKIIFEAVEKIYE
jgi:hypothetical protein